MASCCHTSSLGVSLAQKASKALSRAPLTRMKDERMTRVRDFTLTSMHKVYSRKNSTYHDNRMMRKLIISLHQIQSTLLQQNRVLSSKTRLSNSSSKSIALHRKNFLLRKVSFMSRSLKQTFSRNVLQIMSSTFSQWMAIWQPCKTRIRCLKKLYSKPRHKLNKISSRKRSHRDRILNNSLRFYRPTDQAAYLAIEMFRRLDKLLSIYSKVRKQESQAKIQVRL